MHAQEWAVMTHLVFLCLHPVSCLLLLLSLPNLCVFSPNCTWLCCAILSILPSDPRGNTKTENNWVLSHILWAVCLVGLLGYGGKWVRLSRGMCYWTTVSQYSPELRTRKKRGCGEKGWAGWEEESKERLTSEQMGRHREDQEREEWLGRKEKEGVRQRMGKGKKRRRTKRKAIWWDMVGIENDGGERQNIDIPRWVLALL